MRKLSMEELGRISQEEFRAAEKYPISVVLDNIRSMHNVGSIFRSADAFFIEKLFLCGYTPVPPHRDIHKTALGATETVDWEYVASASEAVKRLKEKGYLVYGVEQATGSFHPEDINIINNRGIAVVFGNEVEGVQQEILDLCDGIIEIPQRGSKHSLNVSVAAGIVLWECFCIFEQKNQKAD